MNVNNPPQVRPTTLQEPPPDSQGVNNLSGRRTGGIPLLRPDELIGIMIVKGVVGLAQVYDRYKSSNQELSKEPSRSEQFFYKNKNQINGVQRLLEIALPPDVRPYLGAVKNTASNYFSLKNFLRGGKINPDSIQVNAGTTALASILHAATFYPGSRGQAIVDRVQSIVNSSFRGSPALAPVRPDAKAIIKLLMVMAGALVADEYTKNSSYSRLQLPKTESSEKLLAVKDNMNAKRFLREHAFISGISAMILMPVIREKIGSALLSLVKNPTEMYKSLSSASVPALVGVGAGLLIADKMRQSSAKADLDTLLVASHNR
jgi:hypothetical protein